MKSLLKAIVAKFKASAPVVAAITGGIWPVRASKSATRPYMVYQVVSSPMELGFGGKRQYETRVQFTLYGDGETTCLDAMSTFCAAFDDADLSLDSGSFFHTQRLTEPYPLMAANDQGVQSGWSTRAFSVDYLFAVRD